MSVIWAIHYRLLLTRILIVSHPGVLMRLSRRWKCNAERVWVWSGSKKQTKSKGGNRSDGVLFYLILFCPSLRKREKSSDEQETKPGCSVAMATATRRSAFFAEYCAVIFDEQEHTCAHLQITHIHTQPHAVRTIKPTVAIRALEKIAIMLDETSVSARPYR